MAICRVNHTGAKDNLAELVGRAVKAGYNVYAKYLPAPLGGNLTEDALLKGQCYPWNDKKNGGLFNCPLDAADQAVVAA